jgi:hypothetical protein
MVADKISMSDFTFKPLNTKNWMDFTTLFEEHGPQNGCWCMYWRTSRTECQKNFGDGNKKAFKAIVESGKVPASWRTSKEELLPGARSPQGRITRF